MFGRRGVQDHKIEVGEIGRAGCGKHDSGRCIFKKGGEPDHPKGIYDDEPDKRECGQIGRWTRFRN